MLSGGLAVLMLGSMAPYAGTAYAAGADEAGSLQDTADPGQTLPEADVFNVDFSSGYEDQSDMRNQLKETFGSPEIAHDAELNRATANFNGKSAYQYYFGKENYDKIGEKVTMECMVKFNDILSEEHDFFSNQEGSGIGLGLYDGELTFFAHVGGSYRQPVADVMANQWYHIVGVVDGTEVKLYVNGVLADVNNDAENPGIQYTPYHQAQTMVLGGDSANGGVQFLSNTEIAFARIYSDSVTDEQVQVMSQNAFEGTAVTEKGEVRLDFAASSGAAENSTWNLNIHANRNRPGNVDRIEYDIVYDTALLEYKEAQLVPENVQISEEEKGRIHVVSDRELSLESTGNYGATRLGKLDFQVKEAADSCETSIRTENFRAWSSGNDVTEEIGNLPEAEKKLNIYAKNSLDLNGDGVIGAGDVALADGEMKSAVAAEAAIYPYKHAVILTMDGAGTVWDPDSIYYAPNNDTLPTKYSDEWTMSKRKNTYAMELLNEEFATSYTAQAVVPSISAQNYFSILHGLPWGDAPADYQLDNDIAESRYFMDFGRAEALYPSVFRAVEKAFPDRPNAAFAEWGAIVNGIVEMDAQVATKNSESQQSFYDVADYIRSDAYKNTSVIYMQNDWMDHVGHGSGYYTDTYWDELQQYDEQYKAVIDALKETGEYDETLIVTNADHGGSGYGHGSMDPSNMDVFIGVGGQTVNSGRRLYGGDNADITPIVLSALRVDVPDSMTGGIFDDTMFLSQEEMEKKNRDIEKVVFNSTEKSAVMSLTGQKSEIRAIDAVIDLNGAEPASVTAEGGEILRQEIVDGKLKVTAAYESQPTELLKISLKSGSETGISVEEIMLGTETGEEIYPDLDNTFEEGLVSTVDTESLNLVIAMAEKMEAEQAATGCYTEETWAAVQTALDAARSLAADESASQEDIDNAFLELITAVNLLENAVQSVGLQAAIEGAKAILEDAEGLEQYTPESVEALRTALAEAERVYAEESADQETINAAARSLMDAVTSLVVVDVDTRLDILIRKAEELLESSEQYTSGSIANLQAALEAAKLVAEDRQAGDEEINEAYSALAEAMASLVRKADKSELKTALDKAAEILADSGRYVEDTITGLQAAADTAQAVYDKEDASPAEVGEAVKSLVDEILKARLLGDVDGNGAVDSADSAEVLKYAAEAQELDDVQSKAADVNRDGAADSMDAAAILGYAAEQTAGF